ncbi:MAG: SIS domain-containing protein [Actinomycetota bacterium]|nr:SIS domain-containing protein [Actinomycetota bacterium]
MTDFLYPFLGRDERDAGPLLEDLARSAQAKAVVSEDLRRATLAALDAELEAAAEAMAERFAGGGRLFTFGNGGSSTDAAGVAALFSRPPSGRPLPARSLVADHAVLTALANDVGYELVFSRQLISAAGPADIALGLSTSGGSANLLRAFGESHRLGLLSVGLAGYDGGAMAGAGTIDHCLVVRSDSVHRIQEVQSAVLFDLWERTQRLIR